MSVRNGFTIEIYGFTQSTYLLARAAHDNHRARATMSKDSRIEDDGRMSPEIWLTTQQLVCQHLTDLLCSLTREGIGRGQHSIVSTAL